MFDVLQKNIDSFPDYSYTLHSIRQNKIIIPNNKYSVDVKKFNLGREEKGNLILSELNYYDSDIINIAPLHYLYFKVNISSEDGIPKNTIDYKLYSTTNSFSKLILKEKGIPIQNNGVAELFFKQINRQNDNITSSYEMFIELKFD